MIPVFVYGTLMRGMPNHWRLRLAGARFQREATTRPEWAMHARPNGWCPEVVEGSDIIHGEVYLIPPFGLDRLDRHEGHPTVYYRSTERLSDGRNVEIYIYQWMPDGAYIPSGSWRAHVGNVRRHYDGRWFSTTEAAILLNIDPSRVRAICAEGRLGQKIGRNWAIELNELTQFARQKRRPGRRPWWERQLRLFR